MNAPDGTTCITTLLVNGELTPCTMIVTHHDSSHGPGLVRRILFDKPITVQADQDLVIQSPSAARVIVTEYINARDAYEEATKAKGFGLPKNLRPGDPIAVRWVNAREKLRSLFDIKQRDDQRDIGAELLQSVRDVKAGMADADAPKLPADEFNGDNAKLIRCIGALLRMDAAGALVPHGIGGHARSLLAAAAHRIAEPSQPVAFCRDGVLFWHGDHAAHRGESYDLYAAPQPAPAIDLEQFREPVMAFKREVIEKERGRRDGSPIRGSDWYRDKCRKIERLLALIGGQTKLQASLNELLGNPEQLLPAPAADPEDVRIVRIIAEKIDEGRLDHPGFYKNGRLSAALRNLLAMIDGQASVRSSSEHNSEVATDPVTDEAVQRLVRAMECTLVDDLIEPNAALCRRLLAAALQPTKGEGE